MGSSAGDAIGSIAECGTEPVSYTHLALDGVVAYTTLCSDIIVYKLNKPVKNKDFILI